MLFQFCVFVVSYSCVWSNSVLTWSHLEFHPNPNLIPCKGCWMPLTTYSQRELIDTQLENFKLINCNVNWDWIIIRILWIRTGNPVSEASCEKRELFLNILYSFVWKSMKENQECTSGGYWEFHKTFLAFKTPKFGICLLILTFKMPKRSVVNA